MAKLLSDRQDMYVYPNYDAHTDAVEEPPALRDTLARPC
jgi:hypothetical protein